MRSNTYELGMLDAYQLLQDGAVALGKVEDNGICIDVPYCRDKIVQLEEQIERCDQAIRKTKLYRAWSERYGSKLSYASMPQLRSVLYADLHVKPFKQTETEADSVDEESLKRTAVAGIAELLQMRRHKKNKDFLSSFMRYQVNGKLYPSFLLHTVQTYRSSSASPNLQNVPKRDKESMDICRRAITPSPGHQILEIDYSGIEVAIAACYHRDPTMLAYLEDPGSDLHSDMAKELVFLSGANGDLKRLEGFSSTVRQASKNGFVFPEFYGDYYSSCARNIACTWFKLPQERKWRSTDGASFDGNPIGRHLIDHGMRSLEDYVVHVQKVERQFWDVRFPVYKRWRQDWYSDYCATGRFAMKTGFLCKGVYARNQAVNYPVQGAAFHCLLWTLIEVVNRTKGWRSKVIGEIHDSVLIDAHPDEVGDLTALVTGIAAADLPQHWPWLIVPMRVEASVSKVDGSWADMTVAA